MSGLSVGSTSAPPPPKRPRGEAGGASQHASGPTVVHLPAAHNLVDLTEVGRLVHDSEDEVGQLIMLAEHMHTHMKSMLKDIRLFKRKLETHCVRLDLVRDVTPTLVAAGEASQHALLSTAFWEELPSTQAEPCARSEAASSCTHGPEAILEPESEEADYGVDSSDEWT